MSEMNDNNEGMQWDTPSEADVELVSFVVQHCDRWRDFRDQNYLEDWLEYERIFRGQWDAQDRTRESERSRIISPATQQAVETRHAEIMEAIFGNGEYFDIKDDVMDYNGNKMDIEAMRSMLREDLERHKIRKSVDQIELMAEIYGTGIGELVVKQETEYVPATQPIPGSTQAAYGVEEKEYFCVKVVPVNPKNFLIDPNATSIEDAMGVAIEKFVSIHKVVEGMEKGIYRKVDIGPSGNDDDLEVTQELVQYQDDKVKLLTYYGLVPREYLEQLENDGAEVVDLFPETSTADTYSDLVEAIVVIGNDGLLLKAEANPYMMKDRPVVAYQDDTIPNRFWGRGTVEKAYNMQKAIDAQLRSHLDSLALTTAPMIAMDATRLPRGAKFEVKPGKAILTNGAPSEILFPFKFGETSQNNALAAQEFERMLLQATGTLDSQGMVSQATRDGGGQQMSMAMGAIIKKYKRTLTNFQEDFLVPLIKKAAFRYMQFDPERYPSVDMKFIPTATLGIMAREYEQQQLIGLLQTLGPDTPVLPVILKGIIANSSLSNRAEMEMALEQMSQPNPEAQQMAQMAQQLQMEQAQAQTQSLQARAQRDQAEAQKTVIEAQLLPEELKAKVISSLSTNIEGDNQDKEFEKRAKIAELMLKEKDINNKGKIVELQMQKNANNT
jgi:formaldehyde-activating enzyme involved in methanogenesis